MKMDYVDFIIVDMEDETRICYGPYCAFNAGDLVLLPGGLTGTVAAVENGSFGGHLHRFLESFFDAPLPRVEAVFRRRDFVYDDEPEKAEEAEA